MDVSMAVSPYDRAMPLVEGRVRPEGITLDCHVDRNSERRQRQVVGGQYDAAEFYMGAYIVATAHGLLDLAAVPIFVKRMFRHSYVYVRKGGAVGSPRDLSGAKVGIQSWATTTAVWMKGILAEDYGVDLASVRWFAQFEEGYLPSTIPGWASVAPVPEGSTLLGQLISGELDAVITTKTWAPFEYPEVDFLFPQYWEVERDYYGRTGFFPIMHVLVLRGDLVRGQPWVARSLHDAWLESKRLTYEWLAWQRVHQTSLWFRRLWEEEHLRSAGDPYVWGLDGSRRELGKLLEYSFEQGLTPRRLSPEELFHATTHDT